jgi:hypothetical protein
LILVKFGAMFNLVPDIDGRYISMLGKGIIFFLAVALLGLSGCVTVKGDDSRASHYGPCAQVMPYYYCVGGP